MLRILAQVTVLVLYLTLASPAVLARRGPPIDCLPPGPGPQYFPSGCAGQHGPYYEYPTNVKPLAEADLAAIQKLVAELDFDYDFPAEPCKQWPDDAPMGVICSDSASARKNESRVIYLGVDKGARGTFTGDYLAALTAIDAVYIAKGNTLPPSWAKAWLGVNEITLRGMSGPIPSEWTAPGAFPLLTVLDLANNQLSGTVPRGVSTPDIWPSLYGLNLSHNSFTGPLPLDIGTHNDSYLESLDLSANSLTGELPPAWGSAGMEYLWQINLGQNNLSGPLPAEWGERPSFGAVFQLDLSNNSLTGTLPSNWAKGFYFGEAPGTRLTFWLEGNQLQGAIPSDWSDGGTLGLQVGGDVFDTTANATDVYVNPGNSICGPVPVNVTAYTADGKPAVLPACNAS